MKGQRVGAVGEAALVAAIAATLREAEPQACTDVIVRLGDDAAVVRSGGRIALTLDAVSAGSDWLVGPTPAAAIGHRAAAVNLSDLAAMGAAPRWLLLGLELDGDTRLEAVLEGVSAAAKLARRYGASVVGGDVGIRPGPSCWTVAAVGDAPAAPLRRDAAVPGQRVWCIGALGCAALGLELLRRGDRDAVAAIRESAELATPDGLVAAVVAAHLWPAPCVEAGLALADAGAPVACIDVSDGLGRDAAAIAAASGVALHLDVVGATWLGGDGVAEAERRGLDWRRALAGGGDDYALLVCAPADLDIAAHVGQRAVAIGWVAAGAGVRLRLDGDDASALLGGHLHGDSAGQRLVPPRTAR